MGQFIFKQNRGQALLFVVVAMTIALTVGVAVSTRTLQMSSRVSRSDTSARVFAAAEGGIDRLLVLSTSDLNKLAAKTQDCNTLGFTPISGDSSRCVLKYEKATDDSIQSQAILSAQTFTNTDFSGSVGYYSIDLIPNRTKNVKLTGMSSIRICWDNPDAAVEYILYGKTTERSFLRASGSSAVINTSSTGFSDISSGTIRDGYPLPYCSDVAISIPGGASGLRIRSVFAPAKAAVIPLNPSQLPVQGFRLYSRGELVQDGQVKTTKAIVVYRSYDAAPSFFDYAIFSNDDVP